MSQRIPLRQLLDDGAADGQVPGWDNTNGLWVPRDAVLGLTSADSSVTIVDNGDGTYDLASAGGGGGGGGVLLIDYGASVPSSTPVGTVIFEKAGTPTPTTWDFRGLSALPSGWARRGVASETFAADGMSASYGPGQGHFYTLPAASKPGTLEVKLVTGPTSAVMLGPQLFSSGANAGAGANWYDAPAGCLVIKLASNFTYASSYANAGGSPAYPVWLRVRYSDTGTTAAYASYSMNGTTWSAEATLAMSLGTLTSIGVGSAYGTGTAKTEYVKWSPGTAAGGVKGWWDGTTVVSFG